MLVITRNVSTNLYQNAGSFRYPALRLATRLLLNPVHHRTKHGVDKI